MKRLYKLAAIALAMLLILPQSVSFHASAESDYVSPENTAAYKKLIAFEILEDNDDLLYEDEITRGTFLRYAMKLAGYEGIETTPVANSFSDVSLQSDCYYEVHFACQTGIISPASSYYPDRAITWSEASKIMLKILGYGGRAEIKGGYPVGYLTVADSADLFMGIDTTTETISNTAFIKLMENCLEAELLSVELVRVQEDNDILILYRGDGVRTLLSEVFGIYEVENILNTNGYTSLYGNSDIPSDCVKIGNKVLYSDSSYFELLGYFVDGYYRQAKDEERGTLVYAEIRDENEQKLSLSGKNILDGSVTANGLSYTDETGRRTKKVSFEPSVVLIYNGMQTPFDKNLIIGKNSNIILIDNDQDGKYEVVRSMKYRTDVVESIDYSGGIMGRLGTQKMELDPESDDYAVAIFKDGKSISPSDISVGDVISFAEPVNANKTVKYALVSSEKIEGKASSVGNETIVIDEVEYNAAPSAINICNPGLTGVFYLDAFGEIVYLQIARDRVFGYLNDIAETGFDKVEARIFTENNRWVTLKLQDKISFNNRSMSAKQFFANEGGSADSYRQLIMYNVNENAEIKSIWFADSSVVQWSDSEYQAIDSDIFRLTKTAAEEQYRAGMSSLGGEIIVDNGTKLFMIPAQTAASSADLDEFYIASSDSLIADKIYYNISAYNCDEFGVAKAIVMVGNAAAVNSSSRLMLVKSVISSLTVDGVETNSIKGMYMGAEVTLQTQDKNVLSGTNLKLGDVIQLSLNSEGYINMVTRLYSADNGAQQSFLSGTAYSLAAMYAGQVQRIDAVSGKRMVLKYGSSNIGIVSLANVTNVYLCEDDRVEKISLQDVLPNDYIFTNVRYFMAQEIVVFR